MMDYKRPFWAEVSNEYFCSDVNAKEDGALLASISIDAWEAGKDEGKVIARVLLSQQGDILVDYIDQVARYDEAAQNAIRASIGNLKEYFQERVPYVPEMTEKLPEEMVIQLAHLAGTMEAEKHLESMDWPDLKYAIQDVIRTYMKDPTENRNIHSLDDVAEHYFIQQFGTEEYKETACRDGWLDMPITALVPAIKADKVLKKEDIDMKDETMNKTSSFYYTFGTADSFPFKKGWVEVKAQDRAEANKLFRKHFPDVNEGYLNCSDLYTEATFPAYQASAAKHPEWNICHGVVTTHGFQPTQKFASLDAQMQTAAEKCSTDPSKVTNVPQREDR